MKRKIRKNFIENIKILKANHKTLRSFAKDKYLDENGVAHINVYVTKETIYNPLTNPENPDISDDIINYIDKESYFIPTDYPIEIDVHSEDELDEKHIENKLKEHYWKELADKDDDLKNNRIIYILLFIVGALFLSLFFVLKNNASTKDLFVEIFSIAATFLIWEAVDYSMIVRNALKIQYLNAAQLALVKVCVRDKK